jgi:TPR repeat protein
MKLEYFCWRGTAFMCFMIALVISISNSNSLGDTLAFPHYDSQEEKDTLEQEALTGSISAADKVTSRYLLTMGNDKLFWATIAAENGSLLGAYNITSILSDLRFLTNNPYGNFVRDRQWFWLKKSSDGGYIYAIKQIKKDFPDKVQKSAASDNEIKQWRLSSRTIEKFKRAAMRGSPNAAYRLYQYYNLPVSDLKEGMFWAIIAAQNEHPKASLVVGKLMLKSNNQRERSRAQFWLRKSAALGDEETTKLLER